MSELVRSSSALTAIQIATLRLVYCGLSSKQIARRLGTSPHTIDARAARAARNLGLPDRGAAARWVMANMPGPYERLIYELMAVAPRLPSAATFSSPNDALIGLSEGVAEIHAAYVPPSNLLREEVRSWKWGNPDEVRPLTRAGLILILAFLILAIVFTLLAMGERASDWARENLPNYSQAND
jgi:DNA-binding CsgD family transcriptional regulator